MSNTINLSGITQQAGEPVDSKPQSFTMTPHAILVGRGTEVIPLRNITRIGKYMLKWKFPIPFIAFLIISGIIAAQVSGGGITTTLGVLMLAGAAFGIWHRLQPGTLALGFECSSGAVLYLHAENEQFVDKALVVVREFLETGGTTSYHFDFRNNSVTNVGGVISGAVAMGDRAETVVVGGGV